MFNLLRRKRQRKTHKSDEDDEETTPPAIARSASNEKREQPQRFSSQQRKSENDREPRRAVIEELEDFPSDDDEELPCVKLAKTAANGHSAISFWRSDNLNINNMGKGSGATTTTTTSRTTTVADAEAKDDHDDDDAVDVDEDRNAAAVAVAVGHGTDSQNEAASVNAKAKANNANDGQLIGNRYSHNIGPLIDGNNGDGGGHDGTVIEAVAYRQQSQSQSNEQKRQSRLSIGSFALQLGKDRDSHKDSVKESEKVIESSKKRKPLQKSREFFSEIFMARGRNHQRQQQRQQQSSSSSSSIKAVNIPHKVVDVIGQAVAKRPATLASAPTHLETNSDPAVSTNSYQMTMSNNRPERIDLNLKEHESHRERRSNSAGAASAEHQHRKESEATEARREHSLSKEKRNNDPSVSWRTTRSLSAEPRRDARDDGDTHRDFIQAANVEQNASGYNAEELKKQQQQQQYHYQRAAGNATLPCIGQQLQEQEQQEQHQFSDITMGQTSAKPNEGTSSAHSSRASTPREFRESTIAGNVPIAPPRLHSQKSQELPKITVVDCSFESVSSNEDQTSSPHPSMGEEVFYDFEAQNHNSSAINIEELNEAHIETLEDEVFATDIPTTIYQNGNGRPWTRLSHVKLENVQEEAEEDDLEADDDDDDLDEAVDMECDEHATPNMSRQSASSERSALKSDSNLSSSYADSGIGIGVESQQTQPPAQQQQQPPQPPPRSSSTTTATLPLRSPFIRDGNSTDCEETLLQCDELDDEHFSERLVCIESISLPDVVVESTTSATTTSTAAATTTTSAAAATNGSSSSSNDHDGHININIANGAGGNSLGNVHFIPIHIEGSNSVRSRSNSPKQRSFDDTCLGHNMPPSVEIIEDSSILNAPLPHQQHGRDTQELKRELKLQKARFSTQLDDAHRNVQNLETKVGDMQVKIQTLEQELSLKQWNVERLQSELTAAHKDDEYVRKKLKLLEDEKVHLRHKYCEDEDEFQRKYNELEAQYNELNQKYKETQSLAGSLQTQLANATDEVEEWRNEVNKIRTELEEQIRILKNAFDNSEAERKICEDKWQKEFEMLRTHNKEREETLMTDCEWQLRQMQRQCKDKVDKCNYERKQASAKADELEQELQSRRKETEHLRICQAQVNSLRGVVSEQEQSIQTLMDRIENLKYELQSANENLEAQIEAVHKIKYQCDNAIYDKERQMIYKIDEVRNDAAAFWENKLYTEMTRLTNELESVYVDERREALDKLQDEHVEELRALTNRYTLNEEELRAEISELHENLELKKQDFLALRERSDNALLQTRMHLDRADREYQNAMCREEDRRADLEEKLKKEFETEKQEMEEKFRERLGQVKDEFAKELQLSTQDMVDSHRKELETQKAKLQAEKDEAMQELVERHRAKITAADERMNDTELRHQRNLKDLKAAYDAEKAALDKRDISNANEIEQLHRKCRCLTNLFEEMRMRYERRDPRPEDLREISELRTRCESQERDLYVLTDRLREMQNQMAELQQNGDADDAQSRKVNGKAIKKPPPKTIPTSCDVIYEENEERESPEQESRVQNNDDNSSEGDENEHEPSDTESNHTIEVNGKCVDHINEDDAHMITAV
ncbi:uncharacterized protein Dwil_GK14245 [Drosophila willistoni]|uniref:Uncharacterized protein n=1 Tax=Drosophila willistoni TaxID=7260 RepID=B4NHS3_DROWI|nr:uncharacterized protein LOC6650842 isoform X1 [Drosophila willistoni]EDW84683.1 uncharacterized protein Dwil_GK14245 [Drosophila willistoni]